MSDYNRTFDTIVLDEEGKAEPERSSLDSCRTSESLLSRESDHGSCDTVMISDIDDDDGRINNERPDSICQTNQSDWDALSTICLRRETMSQLSDSTFSMTDAADTAYQESNGGDGSDIRNDSSRMMTLSTRSHNAVDSQAPVINNDRECQLSFMTRRWLLTTTHTSGMFNDNSKKASTSSTSAIIPPDESITRPRRRINGISSNSQIGNVEFILATAVVVSALNILTCLAILMFHISRL